MHNMYQCIMYVQCVSEYVFRNKNKFNAGNPLEFYDVANKSMPYNWQPTSPITNFACVKECL